VQPVVRLVERDEVRAALVVDDEPVDEQHRVDDPAADQVVARQRSGTRHQHACDAEEQVDDVVQDRHVEDPEQHCPGVVARAHQLVVVGGHAGNEPGNPDEEEYRTHRERGRLHGGTPAGRPSGSTGICCGHDHP
jgi:hypothetical protein